MNQMKPYFMGLATAPATKLTSIQKVFRTSDIEEVGDNRHCTFFEMLGNFSVGDYFKAEVIPWAWELLTSSEGMALAKDRIWASVFEEDDEAYELWRKVGLPPERIVRYPERDSEGHPLNYWFMGPVGPCGPNTEIYYDFGPYDGWRQHDCDPQCDEPDCRRFLELWNLVFMTLFQDEDGSRRPLPQRNVDTGAGFERWPVPLLWQQSVDWQGKPKQWKQPPTIFDTDVFQSVLARVGQLSETQYGLDAQKDRSMRIVAEHARAATFLISDGVTPGNDGRGYVLRRLIRRGMFFGRETTSELHRVAEAVIDHMAGHYPELLENQKTIIRLLIDEEHRFNETIDRADTDLAAEIEALKARDERVFPGERAFYFDATLGFPIELLREVAHLAGLQVDEAGFEAEMEKHRHISRAGAHFGADAERIQTYVELGLPATEFLGYEATRVFATVMAIVLDGTNAAQALTSETADGHKVEVVLSRTPFYAEGGGQIGDRGEIIWPDGRFVVEDTQSVGEGGLTAHTGRFESGALNVGDPVEARVDEALRADIMRNHTATHILHAALRQVLGLHVRQAGSLVTPDRLRFDFTHLEGLAPDEVREVEAIANRVVRENLPVHVEHKRYEEALADGALAFFGDKYANTVRVVGVCYPEHIHPLPVERCFSHELCGGTHVRASGDVGAIVITGETSIGAGLRRIEAVSGRAAIERLRAHEEALAGYSLILKTPHEEIGARIETLLEENDRLRKQVQALERRLAREASQNVAAGEVNGTAVVSQRVEALSANALREVGDGLKARYQSAVLLLAAAIDGKPTFLAMATPDVAKRCPAGDIVRVVAAVAGGGGGGRPEVAQGGGTDVSKIDAALAAGQKLIEEKLQAAS
jgi:alanyl-tRNA synthetase